MKEERVSTKDVYKEVISVQQQVKEIKEEMPKFAKKEEFKALNDEFNKNKEASNHAIMALQFEGKERGRQLDDLKTYAENNKQDQDLNQKQNNKILFAIIIVLVLTLGDMARELISTF